ncbi:hypothetical protein [Corallococcus sp. CA053C]|uniref:hypothetical protein n=1 Tax=Corallococcus sp. CA053C TaxID=2316732 RepID=UPI0011C386A5|nr:hypothetical protein [Corallococcus sp. CA053C]
MGILGPVLRRLLLRRMTQEAAKRAARGLAKKEAQEAAKKAAQKSARKATDAAKKSRDKFNKNKKKSKQNCNKEGKCPLCGRANHDCRYYRSKAEIKKTLLRDAASLKSKLDPGARTFILKTQGEYVPPDYEVSHKIPLYTVPHSRRCTLDKAWNMETLPTTAHRNEHKKCGPTYHTFPPARKAR